MTDGEAPADTLGRPLEGFLAELAAEAPAPGGGSAAAVAVAMAAGLTASVARASGSGWEGAGAAAAQAEQLRLRVSPLVEVDASAYDDALNTLAQRGELAQPDLDAKLGEALDHAAAVPLRIAEAAADVTELAALVATHGEARVRADAAAAAVLAEAAARVAATLVEVNLATTEQDPRVSAARELLARAERGRESAVAAGGD